jgi:multisubunit Na+/H+ antiporter MnhB subunit
MSLRPSPILERGIVVSGGPLLVFSLYLLFAGHNQPGGGFAGGLVAGVAVLLAWSAGGSQTVRRILPVRASIFLGAGLALAAVTGFVPLIAGSSYLESGYLSLSIPVVGDLKVTSALAFDVGVYLVVVGMSLGLVGALGEEPADDITTDDSEVTT